MYSRKYTTAKILGNGMCIHRPIHCSHIFLVVGWYIATHSYNMVLSSNRKDLPVTSVVHLCDNMEAYYFDL